MNTTSLSERDVCTQLITPALVNAGWDLKTQVREEYSYTSGRVTVRGKVTARGEGKRVDYVLFYGGVVLAVIEAKAPSYDIGAGLQQAIGYANDLKAPFAASSNGEGFIFRDETGEAVELEQRLQLKDFPSPEELWRRYCAWKGLTPPAEELVLQPYYDDGSGKQPRYYQRNAINATIEAVARGRNRILLVMATGTGKTFTAFQIIWRLWKSGRAKRILFLADRNILVDQTMVNDFKPFGPAMAKLSTKSKTIEREDGAKVDLTRAIDKKRRIDASYEVYLGLYQAITGPDDRKKLFRELSPDFFDVVVIDECHRGSAADDAAWREILEHFSSAVQIGMTATPKETEYASNTAYFGEPVYTYSLKQGIEDGFLAPYKVVRVHIDRDIDGYRPQLGQRDRDGYEIEDRIYNVKDFDSTLVLDERTKLVAQRITQFLKETGDRFQKTIVFCVDEEHAARMRQALVNQNADIAASNARYVVRITGSDQIGKAELDNFVDPESRYPVIATTSRLLSTGVDAKTCRLIVLDREVGSMTEFKQIVGRGTRIHEESNKLYFTLIDFRGASNHFADPDFDGEPVQIYTPGPNDPVAPPEGADLGAQTMAMQEEQADFDHDPAEAEVHRAERRERRRKVYVHGVAAEIVAERVEYLDVDGHLVTESLRDFTKKALRKEFTSLDQFLRRWKSAERKAAIIEELSEKGLSLDVIAEELGKDLDPFDLICHIAFDAKPLTRRERANSVKKRDIFGRYGETARAVLEALLEKYADEGVVNLDDSNILRIPPLNSMGTPMELARAFGGPTQYLDAVRSLQAALYDTEAA